jgi:L-alanine-DL-glutamate epimerase-like enolase superfamily enzyme
VVEGYALPDEPPQAFAERIAERAAQGFPAIKLELASEADPRLATEKLKLARSLAGDDVDLVVDMAYSWQSVAEATRAVEQWSDERIAWLEDPMPRDRPADIAQLRQRVPIRIGAGDESARAGEMESLLDHDAVDVLRIDATTLGDLHGLAALVASAASRGVDVAAHVHPEIHRHLALAWPELDRVEAFPLDRPFDRTHELLTEPLMGEVDKGYVPAPAKAGTGISLDQAAVKRTARRATRLQAR